MGDMTEAVNRSSSTQSSNTQWSSCVSRSRVYEDGALVASDESLAGLIDRRKSDDAVIWVDLLRPGVTDLETLAPLLGGTAALHPLVVAGMNRAHNRPRLVRFDDHRVIYARAVRWDEQTRLIHSTDVTFIVFDRTFVSIRSDDEFAVQSVLTEWDDDETLVSRGVPYLLHGFLDSIVDGYFDVLDALDDSVQVLEDDMIDKQGPTRSLQIDTFTLRRAIATLARIVLPMNEVFSALLRQGSKVLDPDVLPYYQDVYDHALRGTERIDALRDSIESILSTGLAMQGNSLNETMKKLTAWAAIIAIPTGVTGYFGQNIPFPGYGEKGGFWLSATLLILLAGGLFLSFKRRGWL